MATTRLFCWLPEEEHEFLDYLERTGTVLGLKDDGKVTDRSLLTPRPLPQVLADGNPADILFGKEQHLDDLRITTTNFDGNSTDSSARSFFHVWPGHNNVLYYRRGQYREGKLVLSHLGAEWSYWEPAEGKQVKKTADFVSWGKKVFSWLSRRTLNWDGTHTFRCSDRALEAIREGPETLPY